MGVVGWGEINARKLGYKSKSESRAVMKFGVTLILGYALGVSTALANPKLDCSAIANDYCNLNCLPILAGRCGSDLMVALKDGPGSDKMRCYSPSTLNYDQTKYVDGDCYCTRDEALTSLVEECEQDVETVFASGMANASCYRIPSIIQTPDGALLAFAEQRLSDCGDNGRNNIVLRRREKGSAWGEILMVAESDGTAYSNANPAIVYDSEGKWSILLHFDTMNNPSSTRIGRNMQTWSNDGGKTWEEPVEITDFFPSASQGCMPGPALGVQNNVEGHPLNGRIYFNCHSGNAGNDHVMYWSDDMGKTWVVGEPLGSQFNEVRYGTRGQKESCMKHTADGNSRPSCSACMDFFLARTRA
jgi:hypothetical protein